MTKNILFTGGGSAGHVTPNIALIQAFQQANWNIAYVGSINGIEREIIGRLNIPYYSIATGKLRRHFSWQNFLTPFKVLQGVVQAWNVCRKLRPHVVFSKGGFVAFPLTIAAWLWRIPVAVHESDFTIGLANRLGFPFAKRIFVTFAETAQFISKQRKVIVSGTPIRTSLLQGDAAKGLAFCQFNNTKPVLLIIGGGLGAGIVNDAIRRLLNKLLVDFQIVHLCGKAKLDSQYNHILGYQQFEYINEELPDIFACASLVISRAGANSIYELLALCKPHILIPLSRKASRGDQLANAEHFQRLGLSKVVTEENLNGNELLNSIRETFQRRNEIAARLKDFSLPDTVKIITEELKKLANNIPQ